MLPFIQLPAEIRAAIYDAYFDECVLKFELSSNKPGKMPQFMVHQDIERSLLRTCKWIRHETLPILTGRITLVASDEVSLLYVNAFLGNSYLSRIPRVVIKDLDIHSHKSRFRSPSAGNTMDWIAKTFPALQMLELWYTASGTVAVESTSTFFEKACGRRAVEVVRLKYPCLSIHAMRKPRSFATRIRACVVTLDEGEPRGEQLKLVRYLVDADLWVLLERLSPGK